jgi:hypothetical protein
MRKDTIKDLVRTKITYDKGAKAIKKVGGADKARKLLEKKKAK